MVMLFIQNNPKALEILICCKQIKCASIQMKCVYTSQRAGVPVVGESFYLKNILLFHFYFVFCYFVEFLLLVLSLFSNLSSQSQHITQLRPFKITS